MAFKEKDKWIKDVDAQDWLNNSELGYSIWNNKYRFREDETFDKWVDRVSGGNKEYSQLIRERKALLGGRTLSNRGTGNKASMSNCYCSGYAPDSVDGMLDLAKKLALTYQAQGGQGLSMSKVRPKGAPIRDGQFESDGIIPFMEIFNTVTASISQGGCIAKDELVLTENGYKRIEDVKIGDKVWTKVGFIEVNHVFDKGIQDIYEVITKHGNRIKTTIDHKFAINPNDKIPLKELKVNDMIVGIVPSNQDEIEDLPSQNNVWFDGFEKVLYKDYIVSIELVGQDHVYDLSLVKEHLFSCNGIYVSNSRKGALMISLSAFHPEILSFVTIKSDINKINKANLSVEIDDEFMEAVRTYFKTGEKIVVHRKETYDSGDYEYDVTPIDIYLAICKEAHANAEPGIIYTNRFRNYNIMEKDDDYQIITSNPCGEQPLAADSACNLGSINISEFVVNPYTEKSSFDMEDFKHAVKVSIVALDEVLNEGMKLHALENQRRMAHDYRNVGLGVMGIADMLVKLGITYGSKEAIDLLDKIGYEMFRTAVFTSNGLAKIYGTYPKYKEIIFDSEIMKNHFSEEELRELRKYGLRNNSLLSIAPTGSIASMLGISTGIEPFFMLSYTRRTESLHKDKEVTYKVRIRALDEYMKVKGITDDSNLPEYFIESANVPWKNRIDMQAALQNHIDTAISSTVNLKEETTVDEVAQLYLYAWEKGLKGITIFRENCNRTVILSKDEKKSNNTPSTDTNPIKEHTQQLSDNVAYTVLGNVKPIDLKYVKKTVHIGCGEIRMLISYDKESKKIYDYYTIRKGNGGGCTSNINSLAIIISKYLKIGGQLEEVLEVLNGSEPCNSFSVKRAQGHKLSKGKNCATAMVNMLLEFKKEMDDYYNLIDINEDDDNVIMLDKEEVIITNDNQPIETKVVPTIVTKPKALICETCGTELVPSGGCWNCPTCGFSKCGD